MFEKVRRLREWLKQLLNPMVSKAIDGVSHLIDESYNSRANTQSEKAEKNLDKSDYYSKEAKSHIKKYDELKMRGEKAIGALSRFKEKLNADKINTVHMLSAVPIISNFQKSIDLYGYTHDLSKANRELEEIVKRIEAIEKKQDLLNASVEAISKSPHKWIFVNNKETNTIDLICPELLEYNRVLFENNKDASGTMPNAIYSFRKDNGNLTAVPTVSALIEKSLEHTEAAKNAWMQELNSTNSKNVYNLSMVDIYKNILLKTNGFDYEGHNLVEFNGVKEWAQIIDDVLTVEHSIEEMKCRDVESFIALNEKKAGGRTEFNTALDRINEKDYAGFVKSSYLTDAIIIRDTSLTNNDAFILNYDTDGKLSTVAFRKENGDSTIVFRRDGRGLEYINDRAFDRIYNSDAFRDILAASSLTLDMENAEFKDVARENVRDMGVPRKPNPLARYDSHDVMYNTQKSPDKYKEVANPYYEVDDLLSNSDKNFKRMVKMEKECSQHFPETDVSFNPYNMSLNFDSPTKHLTVFFDKNGNMGDAYIRDVNGTVADSIKVMEKGGILNEKFKESKFITGIIGDMPHHKTELVPAEIKNDSFGEKSVKGDKYKADLGGEER